MSAVLAPHLLPFNRALALAYQAGQLAEALGLGALPEGWPAFPHAFAPERVVEPPAQGLHWGMFLFLTPARDALLGNGGFKGAPQAGQVELGYEIAPPHRGQGWARAAVRQMLLQAWSCTEVQQVRAHTLAEVNASNRVLQHCGFRFAGERPHESLGRLWAWTLDRHHA